MVANFWIGRSFFVLLSVTLVVKDEWDIFCSILFFFEILCEGFMFFLKI